MRRVFFAVPMLLLASTCLAQTVDERGAARLTDDLARYFSRPAFDKGVLNVFATRDSYRLTIDLHALLELLPKQDNIQLDFPNYEMRLTPRDHGTWRVEGEPDFGGSFTVHDPSVRQDMTVSLSGLAFDGVYDPALAYFSSATTSQSRMTITSSDPKQHVEATTGTAIGVVSAVAAPSGGVDLAVRQTITDFVETVDVKNPKAGANLAGGKIPVTFRSPNLVVEMTGKGVRSRSFLDLWAFIVANPSDEMLKARQAEFKSLLRAALPVWQRIDGSYRFKDIAVETPMANFGASEIGISVGMDGVSSSGTVDYGISASKLNIPASIVPAWAAPLLPTDVDLHFGGADIALDGVAGKAIDALDLSRDPPIPAEAQNAIRAEFMAHLPKVVMQRSVVKNGDISVSMEGEMSWPTGRSDKPDAVMTIAVKGYDKITAVLQEAAKSEPEANQAFTGALMAKGFAKTLPDGSLEWKVGVKPDGSVSINGVTIKGPDAAQ
jgi:hypothetical protein